MTPDFARQTAARHRLKLDPYGRNAWRLHGAGVDVRVADLAYLCMSDFLPIPFVAMHWRRHN